MLLLLLMFVLCFFLVILGIYYRNRKRQRNLFLLSASVLFTIMLGFVYHLHSQPTISVIMSTYNRFDLLPRAVDSILNQTYKNFEFIIIDDGSTDDTPEILRNYAQKDHRVIVLTNSSNKGLVFSLNRGLEIARGQFIARMDDDDFSLENRFEIQLRFMKENPDITVVGGPRFVDLGMTKAERQKQIAKYMKQSQNEYRVGKYDVSDAAITSYFEVPIFHPSAFIRTDFLKKNHIKYDEQYESAEDSYFWFHIIQKGGKIVFMPNPLVLRGFSFKKDGYFDEQKESYYRFLQLSISDVFDIPKDHSRWLTDEEICQILSKMTKYIGKKEFITQKSLNHLRKKRKCM